MQKLSSSLRKYMHQRMFEDCQTTNIRHIYKKDTQREHTSKSYGSSLLLVQSYFDISDNTSTYCFVQGKANIGLQHLFPQQAKLWYSSQPIMMCHSIVDT
jgi:hypothetical protein